MFRRRQPAAVSAAVACAVESLEDRRLFALMTFTVDPALSTLRLSGEVAGQLELDEQGGGSLSANYEGSIVADVLDGFVAFPGGGDVVAQSKGSYDPGNTPANYAGEGETGGVFSIKVGDAAVRGLKLDVLSGGAPVALTDTGAFPATGLQLTTTAGRLEYELRVGGDGTVDLGGNTISNLGTGNATLRGEGDNRTLTIPVDITVSEDSAELRLRGTIVAKAGTGAPIDYNNIQLGGGVPGAVTAVTYADADGTVATLSVKGGGGAELVFENATSHTAGKRGAIVVGGEGVRLASINATGTGFGTKVSFAGKGGADGTVTLPGFTSDGPLASLGGKGVNVTGVVDVKGGLGLLTAASVSNATITADSIGAVKVTGDVTDSTITLDAPFAAGVFSLGKLTVGGAISRTRISTPGAIGNVKAATLIRSEIFSGVVGADRFPATAGLATEGAIGNVTVKNFADAILAADTIGKMKLGTVVTNNDGTPFGITADAFAGLQAKNEAGEKLKLKASDDPALLATDLAAQTFADGNFEIRMK